MIVPTGLTANSVTQLYMAQNAFVSNTVTLPVGTPVLNPPPLPPVPVTPPNSTTPIRIYSDSPAAGATLSGVAALGGWAVDDTASISSVTLAVDGAAYGAAAYGGARPAVCAVY